MNLRDLEYVVAVADLQHFGRASERCNVSQPTLSMQVKKLEDMLGVALFERTNKHVMMTPIGSEITQRARRILQDAKEVKELAKAAQDSLSGDFYLGAFPTLAPYYLPEATARIHKKLPKLRLWLVEEKTEILLDKLHKGQLDAAFIALPVADDQLESEMLFHDPFYLAVPRGHPLAGQKMANAKNISGKELLLLEDGHCLRDQALSVCSLIGTSEHQGFRATSLETLRHMVAGGMGITLIPKLALRKDDGIAYIPFEKPVISRTIGLVWRKSSPRKACISALSALMKKKE